MFYHIKIEEYIKEIIRNIIHTTYNNLEEENKSLDNLLANNTKIKNELVSNEDIDNKVLSNEELPQEVNDVLNKEEDSIKDSLKSEEVDDQYNADFELGKNEEEDEALDDIVGESIKQQIIDNTPEARGESEVRRKEEELEMTPEESLMNGNIIEENIEINNEINTNVCEVNFVPQPSHNLVKIQRHKVKILRAGERAETLKECGSKSQNPSEGGEEPTLNKKSQDEITQGTPVITQPKPNTPSQDIESKEEKVNDKDKVRDESIELNMEENKANTATLFMRKEKLFYDSEGDTESKIEDNSRITPKSYADFPKQIEPALYFRRNKAIQRKHEDIQSPEPVYVRMSRLNKEKHTVNKYVKKAQRDLRGSIPRKCRCFACFVKQSGLPPINPVMASNARVLPSIKHHKKITSIEPSAKRQVQFSRRKANKDYVNRTETRISDQGNYSVERKYPSVTKLSGTRSVICRLEPINESSNRSKNAKPKISLPRVEIEHVKMNETQKQEANLRLPLNTEDVEMYEGNNIDWGKSKLFQRIINGEIDLWGIFGKQQILTEKEISELFKKAHKNAYKESIEKTLSLLFDDLNINCKIDKEVNIYVRNIG